MPNTTPADWPQCPVSCNLMRKQMVTFIVTRCHFGKAPKGHSLLAHFEAEGEKKKKDGKMKEQPTMLMKTKGVENQDGQLSSTWHGHLVRHRTRAGGPCHVKIGQYRPGRKTKIWFIIG